MRTMAANPLCREGSPSRRTSLRLSTTSKLKPTTSRSGSGALHSSLAARAVANAHDGGEPVVSRRLTQQAHLFAAVHHVEVEADHVTVGQRSVAFAPVIARVAPGDGPDGHRIRSEERRV